MMQKCGNKMIGVMDGFVQRRNTLSWMGTKKWFLWMEIQVPMLLI